jgi:hypothetical protein
VRRDLVLFMEAILDTHVIQFDGEWMTYEQSPVPFISLDMWWDRRRKTRNR